MMETEDSTDAKVARGAAWLDRHIPGWWEEPDGVAKRIDMDLLDVSHCSECLIGQLIGLFWTEQTRAAIAKLEPALNVPNLGYDNPSGPGQWQVYYDWADQHGFSVEYVPSGLTIPLQFRELDVAWKKLIIERRSKENRNADRTL